MDFDMEFFVVIQVLAVQFVAATQSQLPLAILDDGV